MFKTALMAATMVAALGLGACGTTPGERGLTGAGIGAATGAVIGGVTGGDVGTGAVVGGVVGGVIGHDDEGRHRHRRSAVEEELQGAPTPRRAHRLQASAEKLD